MARPKKGEEKDRPVRIGLWVADWVRAGLDKIAAEEDVPYSDVAHDALATYLKRHGIKEPRA